MKKILIYIGVLLLSVACVQPTIKHNITVELDMRKVENVQSVGIRGEYPPLSWNETFPLSDPDGDGIYTGSFIMDIPYDDFQYKFVLNGSEFELQGQDNRVLNFEGKTELILQA
ncbi:MAG: hypothetical protein AAFY45_28490, partial [Bacteroidota bacterium]